MASNLMKVEPDVVDGYYTVRLRDRGCFGVVKASSKKEAENKVLDYVMNELEGRVLE